MGILPEDIGIADEGGSDDAGEGEADETGMNESSTGETGDELGEDDEFGDTEESSTEDTGGESTGADSDTGTDTEATDETTGGEDGNCAELFEATLALGPNAVEVTDVDALDNECTPPGPETVYAFMPEADTTYTFTLEPAEFAGGFVLVDGSCLPLQEDQCGAPGEPLTAGPFESAPIYVILESESAGSATLTIGTP